nr:SGNH/GDSL hydrolase family protein [uncultured Desulfobacter sp.]
MREVRKSLSLLFVVLLFATLACSSICVSPLFAKGIEEIVVFGDSLSDTGNLYFATTPTDENGDSVQTPKSPPYYQGRFSNGLVWVEYLAMAMGVEVPTPSLLGGTNYAWGGAETGDGISIRKTPNIGTQIGSFLGANSPRDNQLFVLWAGANDIDNEDDPNPQEIVNNIIEHIRTLALASSDDTLNLMIPNLPPLGQTARSQCLGSEISWIFDGISIEFNIILGKALNNLKNELKTADAKELNLYRLDIFSLFQEMLIDPAAFGFTNVSDTVRMSTDDLGCPLGVSIVPDEEELVDNPDEYIFFDDIHPTTAAHKVIAERALEIIADQNTKGHVKIRKHLKNLRNRIFYPCFSN